MCGTVSLGTAWSGGSRMHSTGHIQMSQKWLLPVDAVYHITSFHFTGDDTIKATVVRHNKELRVSDGHSDTADLHVIADSKTWLSFLGKQANLIWALLCRKIRVPLSRRMLFRFETHRLLFERVNNFPQRLKAADLVDRTPIER